MTRRLGFPCYAQGPWPKITHPDQHAIAFTSDCVFVGNDGGIWTRKAVRQESVRQRGRIKCEGTP